MFDSVSVEVWSAGLPLAWSAGPRPIFEERDVSEPERQRKDVFLVPDRWYYLNPARCLLDGLPVIVWPPALDE